MYDEFKTYTHIPATAKTIRKAYVDTADKGKDNLCSIVYDELEHGCYVLDVIYTNLPMKDTQPETAMQQAKFKVNICRVESNNGGEGFATEVERQTRILKNNTTKFKTFHQSDRKSVV